MNQFWQNGRLRNRNGFYGNRFMQRQGNLGFLRQQQPIQDLKATDSIFLPDGSVDLGAVILPECFL